jgi:hypothetical protein
MLANDIAETLDKYGYLDHIGDISESDILPLLPAFVDQLRTAALLQESAAYAAGEEALQALRGRLHGDR